MPIVMMSPVVKLREGPDFAFGARWALVQDFPWDDRGKFLDMTDEDAKALFRKWVEVSSYHGVACPWHIKQQYFSENSRRLRGVPDPAKCKADVKKADGRDTRENCGPGRG